MIALSDRFAHALLLAKTDDGSNVVPEKSRCRVSSMHLVPIDNAALVYAPLFAATAIVWVCATLKSARNSYHRPTGRKK